MKKPMKSVDMFNNPIFSKEENEANREMFLQLHAKDWMNMIKSDRIDNPQERQTLRETRYRICGYPSIKESKNDFKKMEGDFTRNDFLRASRDLRDGQQYGQLEAMPSQRTINVLNHILKGTQSSLLPTEGKEWTSEVRDQYLQKLEAYVFESDFGNTWEENPNRSPYSSSSDNSSGNVSSTSAGNKTKNVHSRSSSESDNPDIKPKKARQDKGILSHIDFGSGGPFGGNGPSGPAGPSGTSGSSVNFSILDNTLFSIIEFIFTHEPICNYIIVLHQLYIDNGLSLCVTLVFILYNFYKNYKNIIHCNLYLYFYNLRNLFLNFKI